MCPVTRPPHKPVNVSVYIRSRKAYDALKLDCTVVENIGALGKSYWSGALEGTLNAKQKLIELISNGGGNFRATAGFTPAINGKLRRGAGTGYIGWVDFGSRAAAIRYLEQYFDIHKCEDRGSKVSRNSGTQLETSEPSSARLAVKSDRSPSTILASPKAGSVHKNQAKSALEKLGFEDAAWWEKSEKKGKPRLKDVGDDPRKWKELIREGNALYAFCLGAEVLYIGKTARGIDARFTGYRQPGKHRATNRKCHDEIWKLLEKEVVRILVWAAPQELQWRDFSINLAAGLEDSLVAHIKPRLNGRKNGDFVTVTQEDEKLAEDA